jgi:hypothetical protein
MVGFNRQAALQCAALVRVTQITRPVSKSSRDSLVGGNQH